MSQAVGRSAPNWGKTAPIPELEGAINLLNQLRAAPRRSDPEWKQAKTQAMAKAHRLLGVKESLSGPDGWNATVEALTHYRDNWRGAILLTLSEALAYVGHKNTLPPGITEADLDGWVLPLGGDRYQLSHEGWAKLRQLGAAVAS